MDMWNPNPRVAEGIRSHFAPINTIGTSEEMPIFAKHADKTAIIRSISHSSNNHEPSVYRTQTGDLGESGLLDETLIAMFGEFGRTPRVNKNQGHDYWGAVQFGVLSGSGIPGGQAHGTADRDSAFPTSNPVSPERLAPLNRDQFQSGTLWSCSQQRRQLMPRRRFQPEEIIQKLREAEVLLSQGRNVSEGLSSDRCDGQHVLPLAKGVRGYLQRSGKASEGTGAGERPVEEAGGRGGS